MDTDEKIRTLTNTSEFDKDLRHPTKEEESRMDKKQFKGHKRTYDPNVEPDIRHGVHHDPYNEHLKDLDRMNVNLNKPTDMDYRDINREEIPTTKDMHHVYKPDAKIQQPKIETKPKKVSHEKFVELPGGQQMELKHEKKETEIIHSKQTQYPGRTNAFSHNHANKSN